MQVESVAIDSIRVGARMRNLDGDRVEALAASIKALGLQTPISVWASDDGSEVRLVAGHHRLAAVRKLGWEDIDCALVNMDDIDRKRWEIAENLHRAELTALERDQHVSEWIRLTEQSATKAKADSEQDVRGSGKGNRKPSQNETVSAGGRGKKSGINQAARELNLPGRTERAKQVNAHRAVKVDSLTEEAKAVAREEGLDNNRSALLNAAKSDTAEGQVKALKATAEQKKIAREVRESLAKQPEPDPQWTLDDEKGYAVLLDAWEAASPTARRQFMREHGRQAA